jgi:hypothetical protein
MIPGLGPIATFRFFDVDFVPKEVCWFFMIFDFFLWVGLYFYMDAVMPNDYGIQKHPCFCFRKSAERYEP